MSVSQSANAKTQPAGLASIPSNKVIIRPIKEGVDDLEIMDALKTPYPGISSIAIEECKEEKLQGVRLVEILFSNNDSLLKLIKDTEGDESSPIRQFITEDSKPEVIYSKQLISQANSSNSNYRGGRRGGRGGYKRGGFGGGRGGYKRGGYNNNNIDDSQAMMMQQMMMMAMMQQQQQPQMQMNPQQQMM